MSSITNTSNGEVEIVDPLAIAYQLAGVDVPVTAADPLPITGTITTSQGPIEYVDVGGTDVTVKEGIRPLPTTLEGGTVDTVASVTDIVNVQSVDLVDTVTSVTNVLNVTDVDSVNLVDLVTSVTTVDTVTDVTTVGTVTSVTDVANVTDVDSVNLVDEVAKSVGWHLNAAAAAVSTATDVNRMPVTERGLQSKAHSVPVMDIGPIPDVVSAGGQGQVIYQATAWERINHVGILNDATPGEYSIGIRDSGTGVICYGSEVRVLASAGLPAAAAVSPREYSQPYNLMPTQELCIWASVPASNATVNFTIEVLE